MTGELTSLSTRVSKEGKEETRQALSPEVGEKGERVEARPLGLLGVECGYVNRAFNCLRRSGDNALEGRGTLLLKVPAALLIRKVRLRLAERKRRLKEKEREEHGRSSQNHMKGVAHRAFPEKWQGKGLIVSKKGKD